MDLDPVTNSRIELKLFKNVENVKELRCSLMKGQLQCCIVKPSLVYDPFQIIVAANKSLTSEKFTTKSIFTEILFNLSISKNISKSLQIFGIDESTHNLLVVTIYRRDEQNKDVFEQIVGEEVDLTNLKDYTDVDAIKKVYKIGDKESSDIPLLDSIISRIATKDFLSH